MNATPESVPVDYDAVIIGAGFSGLYMLHDLRNTMGLKVQVYEAGGGVGGTWYWNRYPGARCDSESWIYCYGFDQDLYKDWTFSERYPTQPEILSYLEHVAERYDLNKDIQFDTRITAATFDDASGTWFVELPDGHEVQTRFLIGAVGSLSAWNDPPFPGVGKSGLEEYHTGRWPHEKVDFTGKRVAVIGTGASGVQSIPMIAKEASELTVFQRTAGWVIPARNGPLDPDFLARTKAEGAELRERIKNSVFGFDYEFCPKNILDSTPEEIRAELDKRWDAGGFPLWLGAYVDPFFVPEANKIMYDYMAERLRERVSDPDLADKLTPKGYPFGVKRIPLDSGYLETMQEPHVNLVLIADNPIAEITTKGVKLADGSEYEVDAIVYATGFDAITGPMKNIDVRGRGGIALRDHWADGPHTYLGLTSAGFPNLFMMTGPQSPGVISNMPVSVEQHVELIGRIIGDMKERGAATIEPTQAAEDGWVEHCAELVAPTLFMEANTWYVGANIPGKPRVFMAYLGFVNAYRDRCNEVVEKDYEGFVFDAAKEGASA